MDDNQRKGGRTGRLGATGREMRGTDDGEDPGIFLVCVCRCDGQNDLIMVL